VRGQKGLHAYTASNEINVVLIDAGARPSRGEAEGSRDTPNRQPPASTTSRRPQKRQTHLTQRRQQHKPLRRRRPQLPAEIRRSTPRLLPETRRGTRRKATRNLSKHHQCTEDSNISGARVDAYVETPTEKYPQRRSSVEFRRDAGNCSKKPNAQQTRHPRGGTHIPPTTSLRGRKTAEGLHRTEIYRHTDQNNPVHAPRLGQVTLVLKKYKALHDL
jgi:hypothetical protein